MTRALLSLDDDVISLDSFDAREQRLKDLIHERLWSRSELDPLTGCQIYTGAWDPSGQGKIRVGRRVCCLARVSAWIYYPGFRLWDVRVAVRTCGCPACFSPQHVRIVLDKATVLREQREAGQMSPRVRLSLAKARLIRGLARQGITPEELGKTFGVRPPAVRAVLRNRTWRE